jgi:hypothetical protein
LISLKFQALQQKKMSEKRQAVGVLENEPPFKKQKVCEKEENVKEKETTTLRNIKYSLWDAERTSMNTVFKNSDLVAFQFLRSHCNLMSNKEIVDDYYASHYEIDDNFLNYLMINIHNNSTEALFKVASNIKKHTFLKLKQVINNPHSIVDFNQRNKDGLTLLEQFIFEHLKIINAINLNEEILMNLRPFVLQCYNNGEESATKTFQALNIVILQSIEFLIVEVGLKTTNIDYLKIENLAYSPFYRCRFLMFENSNDEIHDRKIFNSFLLELKNELLKFNQTRQKKESKTSLEIQNSTVLITDVCHLVASYC